MPLPDWPEAPGPGVLGIERRHVRAMGRFSSECLGYERIFWGGCQWFLYKPWGEVAYGFTILLLPPASVKIEGEVREEREARAKSKNEHKVPSVEDTSHRCLKAGARIVSFTVEDPEADLWQIKPLQ